MIELRDVTKRFGTLAALDGLTLTAPCGSVYGLVGPNGAGKTTAMRHIAGILRQDGGAVLAGGEPVFENSAVKARMMYIPDEPGFLPGVSMDGMRRFYETLYPRFDAALYERLGEVFQLDPKQPIRRLSKGMKKQAAFRLAMAARPHWLILDEPMDGLDPVVRRQTWSALMGDVAENGTTVLISSHDLRQLEDVCDHVGIMRRGRMLLERDLSQLQELTVKVQAVLPEGGTLPPELELLHREQSGRMQTLILRGTRSQALERLNAAGALYAEAAPLTLEEIFMYEMGGVDDEGKAIDL